MKIAINGFFLQRPATGSAEHLYYLLEGLDRVDDSNDYRLLYPCLESTKVVRMPHLGPRFETVMIEGISARLGIRLGKIWWEQAALRQACSAAGADILHSPYFASPLYPNVPTVVTIHDVIPLVLPAYSRPLHVRMYMRLVSAAAQRARAIFTVSQAAKADIAKSLGIPSERIHVTYNAVDHGMQPTTDAASLEAMRDRFGISGDYLLYFGGFDSRKNVERVIRAYHSARASFEKSHQLVLAGSLNLVGHPLYPDPRPLLKKLGMDKDTVVTGRVSEEDKVLLYSAATAFIFPSLYEGFGLPVLEAMACGAPVITSNVSSLPEVAGDAALLADPTSVDALAEAIVRVLNDSALREEMRERGLRRAGHFSWDDSAAKTLEVYRKVLS
jgi:glycosyltransferase involved in cell wall biosynthesis